MGVFFAVVGDFEDTGVSGLGDAAFNGVFAFGVAGFGLTVVVMVASAFAGDGGLTCNFDFDWGFLRRLRLGTCFGRFFLMV